MASICSETKSVILHVKITTAVFTYSTQKANLIQYLNIYDLC